MKVTSKKNKQKHHCNKYKQNNKQSCHWGKYVSLYLR